MEFYYRKKRVYISRNSKNTNIIALWFIFHPSDNSAYIPNNKKQ